MMMPMSSTEQQQSDEEVNSTSKQSGVDQQTPWPSGFKIHSPEEVEEWRKLRNPDYWKELARNQKQPEGVPSDDNGDNDNSNKSKSNSQQVDICVDNENMENDYDRGLSEMSNDDIETASSFATTNTGEAVDTTTKEGGQEEMITVPRAAFESLSEKMDEQNQKINELTVLVNELRNENSAVAQRLNKALDGLTVVASGGVQGNLARGNQQEEGEGPVPPNSETAIERFVRVPSIPRRRPQRGAPKCDECGMKFSTPSAKCVHIQRIHRGKVWTCQYCSMPFRSPSEKCTHLKKEHSDVHAMTIKQGRKRKLAITNQDMEID